MVRGNVEQGIKGLERRIDEGKERGRGLGEGIAVGRRDKRYRCHPSRGIGVRHFVDRLDTVESAEEFEGNQLSTINANMLT